FLGNIASGLNITENGIKGSTEGVKKRLNAIASKLDAKLSASGYQPPQQQLSDDDLINKYLGGQ
ncbi:acyltransferase, partial [Escherichia coli]